MRYGSMRLFHPPLCNRKWLPPDAHHSERQAAWQAIPLTSSASTRYHGRRLRKFLGCRKNVH
jgi:hypothetical protein